MAQAPQVSDPRGLCVLSNRNWDQLFEGFGPTALSFRRFLLGLVDLKIPGFVADKQRLLAQLRRRSTASLLVTAIGTTCSAALFKWHTEQRRQPAAGSNLAACPQLVIWNLFNRVDVRRSSSRFARC